MKIMCVGDVHLTITAPSSCTPSYLDDLFMLLKQCAIKAYKNQVDAVVLAGDIFHHKSPAKNPHKLLHAAIDVFEQFPCPVYVVTGNHDLTNDDMNSIFETQPLGVLIRSGAVKLLTGWTDYPTIKGEPEHWLGDPAIHLPMYGIGWLQEWDDEDHETRKAAVDRDLADFHKRWDGSPTLLVTHAPFFPPGEESPFENYPTEDFADAVIKSPGDPISVYYGHIHYPHGVYESNGMQFANAGALSRGSLHEYNLKRKIQVMIWNSADNTFEIIDLPHKPPEEVFRLQEIQELKDEKMELSDFLSSIDSTKIEITSTESVMNHIREMDLGDDKLLKVIEKLLMDSPK